MWIIGLICNMKRITVVVLSLATLLSCSESKSSILDAYKKEISALKTEAEFDAYWDKLHSLDQEELLKGNKTVKQYDSISLTNMIRTALMFETHKLKYFKQDNPVPTLNIGHSNIGEANVVFWPLLMEYAEVSRKLNTIGISFPDYELEGISLPFYGYSLSNQQLRYTNLLEKLKNENYDLISNSLYTILLKQEKLEKLNLIETLGSWQKQPFKNMKEEGFFQFVKMSDNSLYNLRSERLQKLILVKSEGDTKVYKIEKDPFGWRFKLKSDGKLALVDHNDEILINYSSQL